MDDIDRRLVALLLDDGRASLAMLAHEVGLSSPAVKRRIDKLMDEGIITGFTAVVPPEQLGWTVEGYVALHCKGRVSPEQLRRALAKVPEVVDACTVSGSADAIVRLVATNVQHLEQGLERIREEADLDRTETAIVLSRLIDRRHTL